MSEWVNILQSSAIIILGIGVILQTKLSIKLHDRIRILEFKIYAIHEKEV